ncbi:hypothetical protein J6590_019790 [Homalodisca vitripennis]|nr:hypothetical protein J6590_019790 [Homalodisca vitripennis]
MKDVLWGKERIMSKEEEQKPKQFGGRLAKTPVRNANNQKPLCSSPRIIWVMEP